MIHFQNTIIEEVVQNMDNDVNHITIATNEQGYTKVLDAGFEFVPEDDISFDYDAHETIDLTDIKVDEELKSFINNLNKLGDKPDMSKNSTFKVKRKESNDMAIAWIKDNPWYLDSEFGYCDIQYEMDKICKNHKEEVLDTAISSEVDLKDNKVDLLSTFKNGYISVNDSEESDYEKIITMLNKCKHSKKLEEINKYIISVKDSLNTWEKKNIRYLYYNRVDVIGEILFTYYLNNIYKNVNNLDVLNKYRYYINNNRYLSKVLKNRLMDGLTRVGCVA